MKTAKLCLIQPSVTFIVAVIYTIIVKIHAFISGVLGNISNIFLQVIQFLAYTIRCITYICIFLT